MAQVGTTVIRRPGVTLIQWNNKPVYVATKKDLYLENMFKLTEKYYYDKKLGKVQFLNLINLTLKEFKIAL